MFFFFAERQRVGYLKDTADIHRSRVTTRIAANGCFTRTSLGFFVMSPRWLPFALHCSLGCAFRVLIGSVRNDVYRYGSRIPGIRADTPGGVDRKLNFISFVEFYGICWKASLRILVLA